MANLMAGLRVAGFLSVLLLWSHFSLGGNKKAAFDTGALKAAIETSEKDFSHQEKTKNYRDRRVQETNKTGKAKRKIKIAGQARIPNNYRRSRSSLLLGLGESKNEVKLENTSIDFDSELEEVGIDPAEADRKAPKK